MESIAEGRGNYAGEVKGVYLKHGIIYKTLVNN